MGIQKEITFGPRTATYFKIIGLHSNTLYSSTVVRLAAYENKDQRDKDETSYFKVLPIAIPVVDATRESAYMVLTSLEQFKGCENIMEE